MKKSATIRLSILTASLALTGCGEEPVAMTDKNAPKFTDRAACARHYGEQNCVADARGGGVVYHPFFIPGQTHYYPHAQGYYNGSPNARPAVSSSPSTPKPSSPSPSVPRGGFGSTGATMSGAA